MCLIKAVFSLRSACILGFFPLSVVFLSVIHNFSSWYTSVAAEDCCLQRKKRIRKKKKKKKRIKRLHNNLFELHNFLAVKRTVYGILSFANKCFTLAFCRLFLVFFIFLLLTKNVNPGAPLPFSPLWRREEDEGPGCHFIIYPLSLFSLFFLASPSCAT